MSTNITLPPLDIEHEQRLIGSKLDVIAHALTHGADDIDGTDAASLAYMVGEVQYGFHTICNHYKKKEQSEQPVRIPLEVII